MRGWTLIAGLACAVPSSAQLVIPPPAPAPLPLVDDAVFALGEAQRRMTVPVTIGRRGPWNFIIDTGAERSVVSRQLAGVLGLPAGPMVRVTAMTGTTSVGTVVVRDLAAGRITQAAIAAPALDAFDIGAHGLLGIDALQEQAVGIDFDKNEMTLRPSKRRKSGGGPRGDEIVIAARSLYGQLIVTDAYWRSTKIAVVVDTGSPVSVGNLALLAAMAKRRPRALGPISVVSVTGATLVTDAFAVDDLAIGGIGFSDIPIAFADAPPFRRFGIDKTPALLLGMDSLRLFRRVAIDFSNREIRFTFPRGGVPRDPAINGVNS